MADPRHKAQTISDGIHLPISFQYASAAERTSATGFDSFDRYKFAIQTDTNEIYMLVDESGPTWNLVSSPSGAADHGGLTGLGDDDHSQYLLVDGTRSMSGNLDMDGYDIENVANVDGVDVSSHSTRHETGGADAIDGYNVDLSYIPSNYNDPVNDLIGEHIAAIDNALSSGGVSDHGSLTGLGDDDHTQYLLVDGTRAMSGNLDMGANDLTNINLIDFNPLSLGTVPYQEGRIFYDNQDHTLAVYNDQTDVALELGQDVFVRVVNRTGSTITKGNAVHVNGAQGNRPAVELSNASSDSTAHTLGITTHDILDNSEGIVITNGIIRGIDTSGFSTGDILYVSSVTSGGLVNIKPTGTDIIVKVATALDSTNNGSISVAILPISHIDELHDVNNGTPLDGYYLRGDGSFWSNSDFSSDVLSVLNNNESDIDHGNLSGLSDDDHTQYLLVDGTRAMSGALDMGTNNIINVGTVDGVDVSNHSSRHETGGADAIDGYNVDLVYSPSNYNDPINDVIGEHIAAIDDALATAGSGDVTGPSSSTDNAIARFDGTTGKIIQDSTVIIDDSGNITTSGTVDGVDISNHSARHENGGADEISVAGLAGLLADAQTPLDHASTHITGGSDEIDGDQVDIDWNPSNYTPTTSPTEATSLDHLTAHLAGIDSSIGTIVTDHGGLTGLGDDDHTQYLLVDGTRAMSGALNMGTNNITNVGTVDGVDISNHSARHENGGADEISIAGLSGEAADSQKVSASLNSGAIIGSRSTLNFIEGSNITINIADDGAGDELDITVTASGGSGDVTGPGTHADNILPRFDGANTNTIQTSGITVDDSDNITGAGNFNGVTVESHASRHETGGADAIDGYNVDLVYTPSNYNAPVNNLIGEHIAAIDDALASSGVSDHGALTGLSDDDHTQYLLVDGTRAMSGNLDIGTNNIINVGTVDGVDVSSHASRHETGGADAVDGYNVDLVYTPSNYNAPVNNLIGEHIGAIDDELGNISSSIVTDHGNLTGLGDDDHTQYLLVDGTRAMSGSLNMGTNNITNIGTVDGVDVSTHASRHENGGADEINVAGLSGLLADAQTPLAHASTHITGGSDEIDGDQIDIDWNPSNYTPTTSPTEVTSLDHLTAHLAGIDSSIGTIVTDHGGLTGLSDDDHTQYLLVDGTRAMSGALNMGTNNITNVGTVDGVDISSHAPRHETGGADAIDGYQVDLVYTSTNYNDPVNDLIGEHIAAIDNELGNISSSIVTDHGNLTGLGDDDHTQYLLVNGTRAMSGALDMGTNNITNVGTVDGVDVSSHASRHITGGADEIDGDQLDIDWNPTNYTPTTSPTEATSLDHLTAHLAGIDSSIGTIVTDHGGLTGLGDDDHTQYLLVSGVRAMSGNLDMGTNNITNVGTVDGVDISNHSTRHETGGADAIDGYNVDLVYTPSNYNDPVNDIIGEHIAAIDSDLGTVIHDNVAGEISAITEKPTPVSADLVIIEDSEDSNNKKSVQVGNLPNSGGTSDHGNLSGLLDDDHTQYLLVDGTRAMSGDLNTDGYDIINVSNLTFESEHDNGNSGASMTIDWDNGQKQAVTLTDDVDFTFTDPDGPCNLMLKLIQDGTGDRSPTWPSSTRAPDGYVNISSTASSETVLGIYFDGTLYYITSAPNTDESVTTNLVTTASSSGSGVTDHGNLSGLIDDDHTQYLLVDGTRAMSGNLDLSSNQITNVGQLEMDGYIEMGGENVSNIKVATSNEEFDMGNQSGSLTLDATNGNFQKLQLTSDVTSVTLTPPTLGIGRFQFKVIQDATGGHDITGWPNTVFWPDGYEPELSAPANSIDILSLYYDGTDWFGVETQNFLNSDGYGDQNDDSGGSIENMPQRASLEQWFSAEKQTSALSTQIDDHSDNGNHGTNDGMTLVGDWFNMEGGEGNGARTSITTPTGSYSWMVRVRRSTTSNWLDNNNILVANDTRDLEWVHFHRTDGGGVGNGFNAFHNGTETGSGTTFTSWAVDEVHVVAATYDGTDVSFYVDDMSTPVDVDPLTAPTSNITNLSWFVWGNDGTDQSWRHEASDMLFWRGVELTTSELQQAKDEIEK